MKVLIVVSVFVLISIMLIIVQIFNYKKRILAENSLKKKIKQNNDFDAQYFKIYNDNKKLKYMRHDFARHIAFANELDFDKNIDKNINLIVAMKKIEAFNKGILFRSNIKSFRTEIKEPDMVSMLTNLIDNAIEACDKVDKQDKKISIIIKKGFIELVNDKPENEKPIINGYNTTKNDKNSHGFGIEIINGIVKKYNGYIMNEDKDDKFKTVVVFKE